MYQLLHQYFREKTAIDEKTFATVSACFKLKKARRNEFLLHRGETCRFIYFVNRGCIRLFTTNDKGQEMTRYFAFEGKLGTALSSFISLQPAFEFMQCLEASELLFVSRQQFYEMVDTIPQVNAIYRNMLEMAYITSQERIYGLQGETALERLKWLMDYQPKILSRLSNKVIASYLGVTPYTLSRLKSEL